MANDTDNVSRQSLRRDMQRLRGSLTPKETLFLEELLISGKEIEVKLAHETLLNEDLFFDGWSSKTIDIGDERSQSITLEDLSDSENLHCIRETSSNVSTPSLGSERRQTILEERKKNYLFGKMWKAHQNGLAVSRLGSRRSMLVRRQSVDTSTSSSASRRDFYARQRNDDIFRSMPARRFLTTSSDNNRRGSMRDFRETARSQRLKSMLTSSLPAAPAAAGKPVLRRMASEGASRKSVTFGALPPPRRSSLLSVEEVHDQLPTIPKPVPFARSDSISSVPSLNLHLAHPITSPSNSSVGSIPSLRHAHPIRSQSFRSTSMSSNVSECTFDDEREAYDDKMATDEPPADEKKEEETEVERAVLMRDASRNRYEGMGIELESTPVTSHKTPKFTRPVLMRDASQNTYMGEGVEVADLVMETTVETRPKDVSLSAARRLDSLISFGDQSTDSSWDALRTAESFDETMSYGRVENIFRRTIKRSLSDDDLQGIFLGGSRHLLRESTSLREIRPAVSYTDSWLMDDEDDLDYYDSWKVLDDEYENGYGGGGTLPFVILGTSADDVDAHPHVLSPPLMESLQAFLPMSKSGDNFWMKYSLVRDGASMHTFLQHARGAKYSFLALETTDGEVFGAFTTEPWRKNWNYFGGGESFLWRMRHSRKEKCHSIIDQAHKESEIDVYPYSGENNCIQLCTHDKIGIGGGDGDATIAERVQHVDSPIKDYEWGFGLMLTSDLLSGTSSPCVTFRSPSLSFAHSDGSPFEIINLELWTLTPYANVEDAEKLELGKLFLESHGRLKV